MALGFGANIVTDGLIFNLDFLNKRCYSSGNTGKNLIKQYIFTGINSLTYNASGYMSFFGNGIWIDGGTYLPELRGDFTLEFAVRPGTTQNSYADIFGNHADPYKGIVVQQDGGTTNRYVVYLGVSTTWVGPLATFSITANQWSHVVLIRNGSNAYSYINGSLYTSNAGVNTSLITPNSSRNLMIGNGWEGGNSRVFNGDISYFKIYRFISSFI